jgi:hypothetical protein
MDAPSHGTVTIYKERIREVNSALPKRKRGTEAPPDYFLTSFRQPLPPVLLWTTLITDSAAQASHHPPDDPEIGSSY